MDKDERALLAMTGMGGFRNVRFSENVLDTGRPKIYARTMRLSLFLTMLSGLFALPDATHAESSDATKVCFDALVSARVVRQVPSVVPEPDDDVIIMAWPYFIDLDVVRVREGSAPIGRSTMLSIQHTYWRRGLGVRKWWLRRNTLGGFNVLREENTDRLERCAQGSPAVDPYISPGEGRTLQDLIREGKERHGERP